jgi:hypothetical protein
MGRKFILMNSDLYSLIYPGRIVEYFEATQTATVKICAERIFSNADESDALDERELLYDVPVHVLSGGGWALTVPIAVGDTCSLFFSQIGYDHWLFEDNDKAGLLAGRPSPLLKRQFAEEDGFALVGFNTIPRAIASHTMDGSQWRNAAVDQFIHLKGDGSIVVDSSVKVTINAPVVEVNATTVDVNATTVDVDCTDATIDATTSATVTTPALTVDSPISTFTGLIQCTGIGAGTSPTAGKMSVVGTIDATGDVVGGGKSLTGHTHTETGTETNPPS